MYDVIIGLCCFKYLRNFMGQGILGGYSEFFFFIVYREVRVKFVFDFMLRKLVIKMGKFWVKENQYVVFYLIFQVGYDFFVFS